MRIVSFALLFSLLFCCCKQKDKTPITPDPNFKFEYTARYDSVIVMRPNSTFSFIFNIEVTNGNISNNRLMCTITDLPGNVTLVPGSISVGQILGGVFTFNTGDIPEGIDTMKFTITSPSTGSATHRLILKILPPIDNSGLLVGTYDSSYDFCNTGLYKHKSVVTQDSAYRLAISNINGLGTSFLVKAKVTDIVVVPFQTIGSTKIWGRGSYAKDPMTGNTQYQMTIFDTIVNGIDTQVCTAHVQHK